MSERPGFTLVELTIEILILGILAAVAAPRLLNTTGIATDYGLLHSLEVIRDAIERYATDYNGRLPGVDKKEETFKADLKLYLRKFPRNPIATKPKNADQITMRKKGDPLEDHIDNKTGWIYDSVTGEFRANSDAISNDGITKYCEF